MKKRTFAVLAAALLAVSVLAACQPRVIEVIVTATPLPVTATPTPEPTLTATPVPTETPLPTPTPDRTATQAAEDLTLMQKELEPYGLTAEHGHLAWRGYPVPITVTEYLETNLDHVVDEPVKNFIVKANVKWDSTSGLAGCSIIFRSKGEYEVGNFYEFAWMRLQNAPAWDIGRYEYGKFKRHVTYEALFSDVILDDKGAKNEMVLRVMGDEFKVWINGKPMETYSDKTLEEGVISFTSWQETGETTCTFADGWLWVIDE